MDRIGLELLGVSEMRWSSCGQVQINNFMVLYTGHDKLKRNGVAFIMNWHASRCMLGYNTVSKRLISISLQAKPMNLTLIQVYAPTSDADEKEREEVYNCLEELLEHTPRKDAVTVMGNFQCQDRTPGSRGSVQKFWARWEEWSWELIGRVLHWT